MPYMEVLSCKCIRFCTHYRYQSTCANTCIQSCSKPGPNGTVVALQASYTDSTRGGQHTKGGLLQVWIRLDAVIAAVCLSCCMPLGPVPALRAPNRVQQCCGPVREFIRYQTLFSECNLQKLQIARERVEQDRNTSTGTRYQYRY